MRHTAMFGESEILTLIDRLVRSAPGVDGGKAKVRQITQRQERYRGGYDAVVTTVLPFYVQAKTADFHPIHSKSNITSDRDALGVSRSPGAFAFGLRQHRGTTEPLQHNALYWLSLKAMAGYVCPKFVTENALDLHFEKALLKRRPDIWRYNEIDYHEVTSSQLARIRARHFAGLMTVVPHRLVDHYLHKYSYVDDDCPMVVFHSDPEKVAGAQDFSEFFNNILIDLPDMNHNAGKAVREMPVDIYRRYQLDWIEESLNPENHGLSVTMEDVSRALHAAKISSTTHFTRSITAINYLKKLDWLDLAAFWGSLLSDKYSIRQHMLFRLIY